MDAVAVQRVRQRLEAAPQAPWLHTEVARRMAERLPLMRQKPRCVLDAWPHAGGSAAALAQALPDARVVRLEEGSVRPAPQRPWWQPQRWLAGARESSVVSAEPGAYDMLWANMLLQHVVAPSVLMVQWHQALAVDGFLMFSTLGPGTLASLRRCYQALGWGPPMGPLVDMHDLGDLLVEAGFADPVMDQETVRLRWRTAEDALAELRSLGANVDPGRPPGLRTPAWRQRLGQVLAREAASPDEATIELEFELVYGHAFKAAPRHAVGPQTHIALDDMRRSLRQSRPGRPA